MNLMCAVVSSMLFSMPALAQSLTETNPPSWLQAYMHGTYQYYQVTKVRSFAVQNSTVNKKSIDLFIGIEMSSSWLNADQFSTFLNTELIKALHVFAQCGFGFNNVHVLYLQYSATGLANLNGYASADPYNGPFEFALMQDLPQSARPMVVLNQVGYAESFNADSIQSLISAYGASMVNISNLSFVPFNTAVTYNAQMQTQASYSLFAHEMAHVLGNLEHVQLSTPNLMNAGDGQTPAEIGQAMSGALNTQQCNAILAYQQTPPVAELE
jgi:hypothetical protein